MKICWSLFFVLTVNFSFAQSGEGLQFEKVHGLSQNSVYSIMQDEQGFIWIATADGLNRFDGKSMVVYKPSPLSNKGALTGRVIRSRVLEDEYTNLWFSTEMGLFRFDRRRGVFKMISLLNDTFATQGISVTPVFKSGGQLWLVNSGAGVISYHEATGLSQSYPIFNADGRPKYLQQEGASYYNGFLFVGGMDGLFQFDTLSHKWKLLVAAYGVNCTTFFKDTLYWNQGAEVYFKSIKTGEQGKIKGVHKLQTPAILSMYVDANGNLYTGDGSGNICVKYANAQSFVLIANVNQRRDVQPAYPALSIFVTRSGVLFAGGDVVGLQKADLFRPFFNVYPATHHSEKMNSLFVTSIAEDATGNVMAGSFEGGLHWKKKDAANFAPLIQGKPLPAKAINGNLSRVYKDASGNFWLCYANELFLYMHGQTGYHKIVVQHEGVELTQSIQVYCVLQVDEGWYLGTNIGLIKIAKRGNEYRSTYISIFGQTNIKSLWYESKNRVWLGFESGGVKIVDPENGYEIVHSFLGGAGTKSFAYDSVHAIMYISTMSGLVAKHVPSGTMKIFTEKDGLLNSYIYGVIIGKNELWASSNRGLSRAAIHFQKGSPLPLATFTNYTTKDGLPDDEFNTGAFYKDQNGLFYFGTIKGLTWFDPNNLKPNQRVPDIVFTGVFSNNGKADSMVAAGFIKQLTLPYSGNEMQFTFQALEYANPEVIEYAYQMTGWDKNWVYSQQLNKVRYANLSPGNFIFKVKARKSGGVWSAEKSIDISINPPFYMSYWFYAVAGFFLLGLVVMVTRNIAQRKLREKIQELEKHKAIDKERLRISREMHDDIGAGLTQIVLMSDSARSNIKNEKGKELEDIADTSRQLVSNMSEIIWSLHPGHNTLEQILSHLREQLHQQLEYAGVNYTIQFPDNGSEIVLSNEKRRNMLLITREIVNNAIKHSKAKNISISALLTKERISFEICDDGIGFDVLEVQAGNGLKNIRHRIAEMGGRISFASLVPSGSNIAYFIPFYGTT